MKIYMPLIAIMVAGLFFTGIFSIFSSVADTYSTQYTIDKNYSLYNSGGSQAVYDLMSTMNESKNNMDSLNQKFKNTTMKDTDSLFSFYSLAYNFGINMFGQLTTFKTITLAAAEIIGIPSDIVMVLISIVLFLFVIGVIYLLLGK